MCNFELIDGKYVCSRCGTTVPIFLSATCLTPEFEAYRKEKEKEFAEAVAKSKSNYDSELVIEPPNLMHRMANFGKALVGHALGGFQKASEEQIKERYSICESCSLYINNVCSHESCGCNISDTKKFLNKLAWAEQECPLGKWPKIVSDGV